MHTKLDTKIHRLVQHFHRLRAWDSTVKKDQQELYAIAGSIARAAKNVKTSIVDGEGETPEGEDE